MQKEDRVELRETRRLPNGKGYAVREVIEGTMGTITSMRSPNVAHVSFDGINGVRRVDVGYLIVVTDEVAEQRRAAAQAAKEAKEAALRPGPDDIQSIDDPRIGWIWRMIAAAPIVQNYCGVYDTICDELGIPGRERDFEVKFRLDGLNMTTTVKTMSADAAMAALLAKLPEAEAVRATSNN